MDRPKRPPERGEQGVLIAERYRLSRYISRGTFGEVWEAIDIVTNLRVAIKLQALINAERAAVARDELTALRWASLPGVVRLLDDGVHDGISFQVMALVRGLPFPGRVAVRCADSTQPEGVALLEVTSRFLICLGRLHSIGVFHGDLKPSNVLVDRAGYPTILDLGVACGAYLRRQESDRPGWTWMFMAPEQRAGHPKDRRTDLYSVGVMLKLALAHHAPSPALTMLADALTQEDRSLRPASAEEALALIDETLPEIEAMIAADAAGAETLIDLFNGVEPFIRRRTRAATALWNRTGGERRAMCREVQGWFRAGLAWRENGRITVRPSALGQLTRGYPLVDHPLPPLSRAAADLICWIGLAHPDCRVERLRAVTQWEAVPFEVALAELQAAGAIWHLPNGTIGTWCMRDPAPHWPHERLQAAHRALAQHAEPGSAIAVRHALAADCEAEGLIEEIAACARRLLLDGQGYEAEALLSLGLDLADLRQSRDDAVPLLKVYALSALLAESRAAIRHVQYLIGCITERTPELDAMDALLAAAQTTPTAQVEMLMPRAALLGDPDLERCHRLRLVVNARRASLDAEARAVAECMDWAAAEPARRTGSARRWQGELRFRQGRYDEAVACFTEAAAHSVGRLSALECAMHSAAARLELGDLDAACREARGVADEAAALRLTALEIRAVFVERTAQYRLRRVSAPRPTDVTAAWSLEPDTGALMAAIEAAMAWRSDEHDIAGELAIKVARHFRHHGRHELAGMYRALAIACGLEPKLGEIDALTLHAVRAEQPDFGVQTFGLLAARLEPSDRATRRSAIVGRLREDPNWGRPASQWDDWLDIMSYNEALGLTTAPLGAIEE